MIEYKIKIIGDRYNYTFTKAYDIMCNYSDREIINQMLNENKEYLGNDKIFTIIVEREFK